jgi:hypothetical protein
VSPELVDVAVADADRFHLEHGAPGPQIRNRELALLPGLVAVEHDRTRHLDLPPGRARAACQNALLDLR